MGKPALEVADIFRIHGPAYREAHGHAMGSAQRRVMRAIEVCRTAVLGGHVDQCDRCGHRRISYNSCANRHCNKSQSLARAKWLAKHSAQLSPTHCTARSLSASPLKRLISKAPALQMPQNLRVFVPSRPNLPLRRPLPFLLQPSRIVVSPSWIETIDIDWNPVSSNRIFPKLREPDSPHGYLFFLSQNFGKIPLPYQKPATSAPARSPTPL